jgi:hypothetical protein
VSVGSLLFVYVCERFKKLCSHGLERACGEFAVENLAIFSFFLPSEVLGFLVRSVYTSGVGGRLPGMN